MSRTWRYINRPDDDIYKEVEIMPRYLGILLVLIGLAARAVEQPLDDAVKVTATSAGHAWHYAAEDVTLDGKTYLSYAYLKDDQGERARGWISFDVTGWGRFTATVGVSDAWKNHHGALIIEVDGEQTHEITKRSGEKPQPVDLALTGAKTLTVRFEPSILLAAPAVLRAEQVNPKDGAAMVWVPAGEFVMGSKDNEGYSDERPQRKVYLDGYWLYKYEVTVAQYRAFCAATGRALPHFPQPMTYYESNYSWAGKTGWADPALQQHPIVNVTWHDAQAYAAWAGAQLPTEAQWEKAARGADGRIYPWGNTWDPAKCANRTNSQEKAISTWPVGSFPAGASPCGAHDMAGNVSEWCADWYDAGYYKNAPARNPIGPATGTRRVLRCGSWAGYYVEFILRSAVRNYCTPDYYWYSVGFRCGSSSPGP